MVRHYGKVLQGIDVVSDALKVEDFPMTREDLDYAVGDVEVESTDGLFVAVRRVLDIVPQRTFNTVGEVVRAIKENVDHVKHKHRHQVA